MKLITVITIITIININIVYSKFECPKDDILGGCRGSKDCRYLNPEDCSSFIQCSNLGISYIMPCEPGTEWNDNKKECDESVDSTCKKTK